jgi:general secretion pathway protein H
MGISALGRPARPCRESGFTLIEILVVVVIIGVISAIAVLGLGNLGNDRELQNEARRMTSLIEMASDEATMQGRDFGLEVLQTSYRFVEFDSLTEQWYEVIGDDLMRPRQLAQDTEFELFLEDRRVLLELEAADIAQDNDDDDDRDLIDDYLPHILVLSSGDISPFELEIIRMTDRASVQLSVSPAGELKVGASEDE